VVLNATTISSDPEIAAEAARAMYDLRNKEGLEVFRGCG